MSPLFHHLHSPLSRIVEYWTWYFFSLQHMKSKGKIIRGSRPLPHPIPSGSALEMSEMVQDFYGRLRLIFSVLKALKFILKSIRIVMLQVYCTISFCFKMFGIVYTSHCNLPLNMYMYFGGGSLMKVQYQKLNNQCIITIYHMWCIYLREEV